MSPATISRPVTARRSGQLSLDALVAPRRPPRAPAAAPAVPAPPAGPASSAAAPSAAPSSAPAAGGTLDDLIAGAWRDLGAQRVAACPVCAEPMRPSPAAAAGQCGGCGARLA